MFGRPKRPPKAPLSARERLERQAVPADDGGRAGYTVALAVLVFLLVGALSARQVTAEAEARTVLAAGIATIAEIDLVLAEHGAELRQLAASSATDPFQVPGYPLPIFVGKAEVAAASEAELRRIILDRSTALVYVDGLDAFDRTGQQSLDTFSSQGLLELFVGQLSSGTHEAANLAAMILAGGVGIVAVVLILRGEGFGRVRAVGGALIFGALPGAAAAWGLRWVARQVFGGDEFGADLATISDAVAGVPIQNYLTVAALGGALLILGLVLPPIARALEPGRRPQTITYRPIQEPAVPSFEPPSIEAGEPAPAGVLRAEDDPTSA